jgi:predicted GNAT family N-acyltransferase
MGDNILTLGEKLPKDSAEVLFKTYADMVDATEEITELLKDNLGDKATPEMINQTKNSLLIGGKDLLEKYAKKVSVCEEVECEKIGEELKERLALAKKSVFAFSYVCKTLVDNGNFSFEDFKKAKLVYDQAPVAEEIAEKIIAMHHANTKEYPPKLGEKWRTTLKDGLKNPNSDQLVVHVSFEDEVVSAMRVIKQEDGSWYGASFNVNPTVQGSKVGSELLKKVLQDLAKDKPFVADCYSGNPMLKTYLDKFGFKITKEIENYEDTGELVYKITLDPKTES